MWSAIVQDLPKLRDAAVKEVARLTALEADC
jgi:hypothetical protein